MDDELSMDGVKPNEFQEETAPGPSNFEFYSQRGGNSRRAAWNTMRRALAAIVGGFINYVPTSSGNLNNRVEFVTDPNGSVWYIDGSGNAIKLNQSNNAQLYEDLGNITGDIIEPTATLPSSGAEWRINLYRSGVRMTYGKDYSVTTGQIVLNLEALDEPFILIIIPE